MIHLGIDGSVALILWIAEIVGFLLSAFWRPSIGLYILIPLLPLQTIRYRLHDYFLGSQFIDVLLLGVIIGLVRLRLPVFPKTPISRLLWLFVIYTYLSMIRGSFFLGVDLPLWFSDPRVSEWKNYVVDLTLIFFVTTSAIRTKRQMGILIACMCVGCLMLAKGLHNNIADRDFSAFSYELRDDGPMGFAGVNGLAALAAQMGVFLTALLFVANRLWQKIGYLGVLAGCLYCLLFALSRGGYAAFLIGVIFLGFIRNRSLLIITFAFLLGWQGFVPTAVRERIFMTEENGEMDHSAAARVSLWEEGMRVFQADPVFGTGFNTYSYGEHVGGYGDTHNLYVKVLVETGLVGLTLFLTIFFRLFKIGFSLYRWGSDPFLVSLGLGFAGLMVAALIANFFGDRWMYFQITGYTYALAALCVRGMQMTEEEQEEEGEPSGELEQTAEVTA